MGSYTPLLAFLAMSAIACVQTQPSPSTYANFEDEALSIANGVSAQRWPGITSVTISMDGKTLVSAFAPEISTDTLHDTRSATKSVTALLVGELLEDNADLDVNDRIADLLPTRFNDLPPDDLRRNITIRDLLTMRSGFACDDWVPASLGHEDKMYQSDDWVGFFLSQPLSHESGEHFSYCTGGVLLLGELIEEVSEQSISSFAQERLFAPLNIVDAKWETTPEGGTDTGGHLRLTSSDFHKIGILMSRRGRWGGQQIISEQWWSEVVALQTDVYERRATYGYLWWRDSIRFDDDGPSIDYFYAHGNGGNFIFVVPSHEFVVSFTGVNFGSRLQFQALSIFRDMLAPHLLQTR